MLFASVECLELPGNVAAHFTICDLRRGDRIFDVAPDAFDEVCGQADVSKVPRDLLFNLGHGQRREIADPLLPTATDEVVVDTTAAFDLAEDETTERALLEAFLAVQQPLQVVVMRDVSLAPLRPFGQDVLHAKEQFFRNQGLVASGEELADVSDDPRVVRVVQDLRYLALRDRLGWPATRRTCPQALISEGSVQLIDRVVA
nr:hypothetical protein [uncultured Schumannella sp.]